jgi:hypothetical protein
VAIFWNERSEDATPFLVAYEQLLKEFGTDYAQTRHRDIGAHQLQEFFGSDYRSFQFPNQQQFNFEGLKGRLLSSSYTPPPGHPRYEPMLRRLREIYDAHVENGLVEFFYTTSLHIGELRSGIGRDGRAGS